MSPWASVGSLLLPATGSAAVTAVPVTSSIGVRIALIFTAPFITCTGSENLPGLLGISV
jgi:hypothetical protein